MSVSIRARQGGQWVAALLSVAGLAVACSDSAGPVSPSSASSEEPTIAAKPDGSPANLSPASLEDRGWTCLQPIPTRIVCSRPNQGFPELGPPANRPASFTFMVFDPSTGRFVGTEVLIRTDLYRGQVCESTGAPYDFIDVIGYYECVHTVGP